MPAKGEVEHHAGYGVALAILALLLIHATALIMIFSDVNLRTGQHGDDVHLRYPLTFDGATPPRAGDHGHSELWTDIKNNTDSTYSSQPPTMLFPKPTTVSHYPEHNSTTIIIPASEMPAMQDIVSIVVSKRHSGSRDAWHVSEYGPNIIRMPHTHKDIPKPFNSILSNQFALLTMWDNLVGMFKTFWGNAMGFHQMIREGLVDLRLHTDVIFLVHGWHGRTNDTEFFLSANRLLTRMIPSAAVVYVSWDPQGAMEPAADAILLARRINVTQFLYAVPSNMGIQCIGHSLGSYVCGSICRQYYYTGKGRCKRILGINAYEILSTDSSLISRIQSDTIRSDAEYVSIFSMGERYIRTVYKDADEYIVAKGISRGVSTCVNPFAWKFSLCTRGVKGREYCENFGANNVTFTSGLREDGSEICERLIPVMAVLQTLDVSSTYALLQLDPKRPSGMTAHISSVWNVYVLEKDYRYATYAKNEPVWYSTVLSVGPNGFTPAAVFAVLSRSDTPVIIRDAIQQRYSLWGNISMHSAFIEDSPTHFPSIDIRIQSPILGAFAWKGRVYSGPRIQIPVPEQAVVDYNCLPKDADHLCVSTKNVSSITIWRKLLLANYSFSILSIDDCLPYIPHMAVIWKHPAIEVATWRNITVTFHPSVQLMAMRFENVLTPRNYTLMTFHDVCRADEINSGIFFEYDWLGANMTIAVSKAGSYVLRWFFEMGIYEIPIAVYENERE
ncbi:lipase [Meleagrid alphaherpesvirus 1]|uniref:Lipase n=1 Tax=Meleagrid herpesvirus 1 TaxID=37108 RepID=Q9DPT5_MEHV1|nr:lipase [Meleagrid alphaherpesvirus 1]AAG45735.1 lipase [Meleagrid alphaherpesvirus 1]